MIRLTRSVELWIGDLIRKHEGREGGRKSQVCRIGRVGGCGWGWRRWRVPRLVGKGGSPEENDVAYFPSARCGSSFRTLCESDVPVKEHNILAHFGRVWVEGWLRESGRAGVGKLSSCASLGKRRAPLCPLARVFMFELLTCIDLPLTVANE